MNNSKHYLTPPRKTTISIVPPPAVAVLAGSFSALPTGIFTLPGAAGIPTGAGLAAGGTAIFSTGLGLFVHGRQKGISKNMSDFADECSNTQQ